MKKSARQVAIHDIQEELLSESKSFICFRTSLNPIISRITNDYIKEQQSKTTK